MYHIAPEKCGTYMNAFQKMMNQQFWKKFFKQFLNNLHTRLHY